MKLRTLSIILFMIISTQAFPQTVSDMLERAISSVVTVAIYEKEETQKLYGHRTRGRKRGETNVGAEKTAYEKMLDLGGLPCGSGFVIVHSGKKYVITNAHVIDMASTIEGSICVYSINRTKYRMKVVGGDTFYDIAVLEFIDRPGSEITSLEFRHDEARIGEPVYAIGNPLGIYPYSISEGIVGGKNRVLGHGITGKFGYLQSTATISWGNSGGPLIDAKGKVVGINSQIEVSQIGFQTYIPSQLNFALEADLSQRLINEIINNKGVVRRAFLGLEVSQKYELSSFTYESQLLDSLPVITRVFSNTPAEEYLKNKTGFVITNINGVDVRNLQEILGEFEKIKPGENVKLTIKKYGKDETVKFTTEELNETRLEELVNYVFEKDQLGNLEKKGDKIVYSRKQDKFSEWRVFSVGISENMMWSVNNLSDIGFAMRLTGLLGVMDLYIEGNSYDEGTIERIYFSGDEGILKLALWY